MLSARFARRPGIFSCFAPFQRSGLILVAGWCADADAIDFDGFLRLLKVASSTDHLDQVRTLASLDSVELLLELEYPV